MAILKVLGKIFKGDSFEIMSQKSSKNSVQIQGRGNVVIHGSGKVVGGDDNSITINGERVDLGDITQVKIEIEGDVKSLEVDSGDVNISGNTGNIRVSQGSVETKGDIKGDVRVSQGNVEAINIQGGCTVSQGIVNATTVTGDLRM